MNKTNSKNIVLSKHLNHTHIGVSNLLKRFISIKRTAKMISYGLFQAI